jgi:hypothetical protein
MPSKVPTPWPTPLIGTSSSISNCGDLGQVYNVYTSKINSFNFPGLSIQYFGEYKVVTLKNKNGEFISYVLYMCNTPDQKMLDDLGHIHAKTYVKIPLKRIGFTSTSIGHAMELIGLQPAMRVTGSPIEWISSKCLLKLNEIGELISAYNWEDSKLDNSIFKKNVEVVFGTEEEVENGLYNGLAIPSTWFNSTALDSSKQLISFLSVFFNQENIANNVINSITNNYKCTSKTAKRNANPVSIRKVLWCDYGGKAQVQAPGGESHVTQMFSEDIWSCKTCPGIECSLVKDAGGKLLDYQDFGDHTVVVNGVHYLESTEFMEMAVFADVWINSGSDYSDFNDTLSVLLQENYADMPNGWLPLTEIPAVKQKRVYDLYKKGYYNSKANV